MSVKTLFIGVDGATFSILDDLTSSNGREPAMPFLSSLYRNGARATLKSTPNPLTPPAWVSLMTGRTPGNHGVYDFIRAQELGEDVYFTLYDSRDCRCETIWSMLNRQGKRFAALNFPFTAPPQKGLDGFMIPGFVSWRHLRRNTIPVDFYDRLKSLPGFSPSELAWDFEREKQAIEVLTGKEREDWVRYHLPREKQWFNIAKYLMIEEEPDLMAVMFDGVDKLQHQAWLFLDPELKHIGKDEYYDNMRRLCLDYFRQLDGFIKELVQIAGPEVQLFIASDHGFTTTYEVLRINSYLQEKGYLQWKRTSGSEEDLRREKSNFANLDWKNTLAYCRTPSSNGIWIRIADGPEDIGVPKNDYEKFRDKLIRDLEQLCDPDTGERVITNIYKREEVFAGPAMNDAPDLLLRLRDFGFVSIKDKWPVLEKREEPAGTHHPEGVFFAYGPGIVKGQRIDEFNITDVPAVLMHSLGLQIPSDLEGRVSAEIFEPSYLTENPIRMGPATTKQIKEETSEEVSEDEKSKIMAQLQMLGYME